MTLMDVACSYSILVSLIDDVDVLLSGACSLVIRASGVCKGSGIEAPRYLAETPVARGTALGSEDDAAAFNEFIGA